MTHLKQLAAGLIGLGISFGPQTGATATGDTAPDFRIMSDQEVSAHQAAMAVLQGAAREDYRNAQYQQLRQRALEQGFKMPSDPPWAGRHDVAASAARGPDSAGPAAPAADAAARHAAMRDKLEASREAMQKAADANLERLQQAAGAQQKQIEADTRAAQPESAVADEVRPGPAEADVAAAPDAAIEVAAPSEAAVAPPVSAAAPAPTPPPAPATPPVAARFAPAEQTVKLDEAEPAADDAAVRAAGTQTAPPTMPDPPAAPTQPSAPDTAAAAGYARSDAMTAYRETMRARFDEYMKERQAQHAENVQRQREQHEATMEQNRAQANRGRFQPYPYPAAPAYGPRYPAAFPGYRTPYWQQ